MMHLLSQSTSDGPLPNVNTFLHLGVSDGIYYQFMTVNANLMQLTLNGLCGRRSIQVSGDLDHQHMCFDMLVKPGSPVVPAWEYYFAV